VNLASLVSSALANLTASQLYVLFKKMISPAVKHAEREYFIFVLP
jgi:hypothetical protein